MQLLRSFRLSVYLTLGFACLALHYAEDGLLPETPYITAVVIALLFVGYRLEGRWALSLHAANMVGAALTLLLVGWIALQFVPQRSAILAQIEFPTKLLPYLGPVLMILIPVKLFRPKHIGDFWAMQGIGLLAVALGCAMANDLVFGILLVIYLSSFVWSLSLFYLYREIPPENAANPASGGLGFRGLLLFGAASRWSSLIVGAGLVTFLILPRPNDKKWELPLRVKGKVETGAPEGQLDLNRVGSVEPNKDVAFDVYAQDLNQLAILDLNPNQRWKLKSLSHYASGKWSQEMKEKFVTPSRVLPFRQPVNPDLELFERMRATLPDFGTQRFFLTYSIRPNSGAQNVLADPVYWREGDSPPIFIFGPRPPTVQQLQDGTFDWMGGYMNDGRASYCQVYTPTAEPDLSPPMRLEVPSTKRRNEGAYLTQLPQSQVNRLRQWTWNVLERLIGDGRIPAAVRDERDPNTLLPNTKHHELIARALNSYLASSGEYSYSLMLEKKDTKIDPVEDFLYNTKSGHCQRFASGLALMLRSIGVPTQLAVGYKGCESAGDGWYRVRQFNAHAWVEVLIGRSPPTALLPPLHDRNPPLQKNPVSYHWLSMDPTPSDEGVSQDTGSSDWLATGESFFKSFILLYDSEQRKNAVASLMRTLEEFEESVEQGEFNQPTIISLATLLLIPVALGIRRLRRRAARRGPDQLVNSHRVVFHDRLMRLLAKHGWELQPGETALEFARRVSSDLRTAGATEGASARNFTDVADMPLMNAQAYYRVRFRGEELTEAERLELSESVKRMAQELQGYMHVRTTA